MQQTSDQKNSETITAQMSSLSIDTVTQQAPKQKKKTKKKGMTKKIAERRKANLRTRFNSLPTEIKVKIFLEFDCYDLTDLQDVCSHWNKFIDQLFAFERVEGTPHERRSRIGFLLSWFHDRISFEVYQMRYPIKDIINTGTIAMVLGWDVEEDDEFYEYEVEEVDHYYVFGLLEDLSRNISERLEMGGYAEWEDIFWDYILQLTGEEYSIEDLKKVDINGKLVKSHMPKYRWYSWTEEEDYNDREYVGLITLNPDGKTFAILRFPNIERYDDEDDFEGIYGYGGGGYYDSDEYDENDYWDDDYDDDYDEDSDEYDEEDSDENDL